MEVSVGEFVEFQSRASCVMSAHALLWSLHPHRGQQERTKSESILLVVSCAALCSCRSVLATLALEKDMVSFVCVVFSLVLR